jgi:prepilin-type N-terminal cleavage/methylation domain-containing protein
MNSHYKSALTRNGFTLVELLVVILIIAVLAVLSFMGASMFIKKAAAAKDSSTLRQISVGINMYASDHNDYLPGPLFTGQSPVYNKPLSNNIKEWRRLADCLAPYMGYDDPKSGDVIEPMTSSWQKDSVSKNAPAFYMQQKLPLGENGFIFQCPWGKPAPAVSDERTPMKLQTVLAQPRTVNTWAMTEVDQTHPNIGEPDWKSKTPPGMIHGNYRLALYFDGTVRKLDKNNNPL